MNRIIKAKVERFYPGIRGQPGVKLEGREFILDQAPEVKIPFLTKELEGKVITVETKWDKDKRRTFAVNLLPEGQEVIDTFFNSINKAQPSVEIHYQGNCFKVPIYTKKDFKRAVTFIKLLEEGFEESGVKKK